MQQITISAWVIPKYVEYLPTPQFLVSEKEGGRY